LYRSLNRGDDLKPFLYAIALFFLSFIGLIISIFPDIVPPSITIWEAASPQKSLNFLLVGVLIFLPVIFLYTGYTYWIFRGKVKEGDHYH